jgi:hypothetical protein
MNFRGPGFRVPEEIFREDLPHKTLALLVFLMHAVDNNNYCRASYPAMMEGAQCSRDSVWQSLKLLRKLGWVYGIRRHGSRPSTFQLRIPPRFSGMNVQLKPGTVVILPDYQSELRTSTSPKRPTAGGGL